MFADDTIITVSAQTPEELAGKVTQVCNELDTWCQRNQLILNDKKTVYINFHTRKVLPPDFLINNNMNVVQKLKFLGTWLDNKLSWNDHIDSVCNKLSSAFFAILQMKTVLDTNGLLNIYYLSLQSFVLEYNYMGCRQKYKENFNITKKNNTTHL